MGQRQSAPANSSPTERRNSRLPTDMTAFRLHPPVTPLVEEAPPYAYADDAAHQSEWNDCDMPVRSSEFVTHDETPVLNPFVFDGARPVNAARRKNVILFGETGVGKSSVINLIAGADVAKTSSDLEGCTMQATEYSFTLSGETPLCIYDTVGLNESEMGVNTFFGAIEKAHQLITSLHQAGGIDLLLFCIRGNRITNTMPRNYRLFYEFLCGKKVPLAFVVTNLEYEEPMEAWWARNEGAFEKYGIQSVAHACVTAAPPRSPMLVAKRAESRSALQKMLHDALSSNPIPYTKDVWGWFASLVDMIRSFFFRNMPASLRKRDLLNRLKDDCALEPDDAQRLADMLTRGGG